MLKTLILFLGLILIYSAFLTRTYYWDGVLFSLYIEKVSRGELPHSILFHPNHLLYSGFGYLLYSLLLSLGLHFRAITLLQCANVLASAGAAALMFTLAKRLFSLTNLAIFCSSLFAFGATWWKFSTDADSYVLSVLLSLLAVSFVLNERRSLLFAGACHTLAMLFHQLAVFIYAPVLVAILWENRPSSVRVRHACAYVFGTSGCVALAYRLAYSFAGRDSGHTFLGWITSFSAQSQMTHSWRQIFIQYPASYLKLLAGGKLSLIRDYLSPLVIAALALSVLAFVAGV
ncbi:MAG: glycosyltransferase family 39 protein, partial [Acidobacteriaceae bacterium]|nr:glycosyltransferase family 39 protein [Acidobacteriaceae bacterium]